MARKRAYRNLKSEINIIPLLDVLLVLVLIFMATAQVLTQKVEVDLPDTTDFKIINNYNNPLVIIEIADTGKYSLVIDHHRQEHLSSTQVVSEVRARIAANSKTMFLIGGAKDVPYHEIIKTLDLLHQAGVKSVSLMTQPI